MSFCVCIHGRTVPSADGPCLDCAELEALRSLDRMCRAPSVCVPSEQSLSQCRLSGAAECSCDVLVLLDAIRTRRGPGALGACTCRLVGYDRLADRACPQHGSQR